MPGRPEQTSPYATATELPGCVDPLALHRYAPHRYPFLLQSTAANFELGRFDILFACPGEHIVLNALGDLDASGGFLGTLDSHWRREQHSTALTTLPFSGGWFLYLGYELAGEIEPSLKLGRDSLLPVAFAVRCPAAIVRDAVTGVSWLVEEHGTDVGESIRPDVEQLTQSNGKPFDNSAGLRDIIEADPEEFLDAVVQAKQRIAAGDVYQANLSRAWTVRVDATLTADRTYRRLRAANPGPFAGLARWRDAAIISSSPERLVRVRDGVASTRPIAGTRPRSANKTEDASLSAELFAHPKERAEHVMLIDLERNDLGRICVPGTVEVNENMVLESYAHVHHIVSNIRGRVRPNVTPGDTVRAVFPGGTITGCPKVRCMEIIDALESGPRGAYTGSFGYLNRDGSLDLNILIRTMVQHGNQLRFSAGSGIVADSEPLAELAETRAKAKGLLNALSGQQ